MYIKRGPLSFVTPRFLVISRCATNWMQKKHEIFDEMRISFISCSNFNSQGMEVIYKLVEMIVMQVIHDLDPVR